MDVGIHRVRIGLRWCDKGINFEVLNLKGRGLGLSKDDDARGEHFNLG